MLFEGRPFVVEMEDAKRCDLSAQEYRVFLEFRNEGQDLQELINTRTKSIRVIDLRPCSAVRLFLEFQK